MWGDSSCMFTIILQYQEVPFVMYVCDFQAAPLFKTQQVIDFPCAQGEWQLEDYQFVFPLPLSSQVIFML